MKRIMVTQIGEPSESLVVQEVDDLQPKAGEVLVEMLAIPIHPADLLVMRGRHFSFSLYIIALLVALILNRLPLQHLVVFF